MPESATVPVRPAFPLTPTQARGAAKVVFTPMDKGDKLTKFTDRMVEGDQWLNGAGWIGPWTSGADFLSVTVRDETRRSFQQRNVLREATRRHATGVLGREPRYDFVPRTPIPLGEDGAPTAEGAALEKRRREVVDAVTAWWDRTKPHKAMKEALGYALYCRRGVVRPYIHLGKLAQLVGASTDPGTVSVPDVATLDDALSLIEVEAVHPRDGAVLTSPRDGSPVAVVYYTVETVVNGAQVVSWPRVQWTFLLPDRTTIQVDEDASTEQAVRTRRALGNVTVAPPPAQATTFALGGRVPVIQFTVEPLITPSVLQQQAGINFYLSALPRTIADAGWMERIFVNIEPPGTWDYDADGKRIAGSFKPGVHRTGPRTANFYQGIPLDVEDQNGIRQTLAPGQVIHRPPVDPEFAIKSVRAGYMTILDEVHQAHVFLQQQGEASGRSHEMARADYEGTLNDSATEVNPAGRALLEAVVALAEDLLGTPGEWTDEFRAEFQCRLSLGAQTADEAAADVQRVQAGIISRETAAERAYVDDVASEENRRDTDPDVQSARLKAMLEVMVLAVNAGMDAATAADVAGLPKAVIDKIKKADAEAQAQLEKNMSLGQPAVPPNGAPPEPPNGGPPNAPPNGKPKPANAAAA